MYQDRVPNSAGVRRDERALKTRKVGSRDVEFLSDLLRYRLVGYGVGMEEAKKLFELKVE